MKSVRADFAGPQSGQANYSHHEPEISPARGECVIPTTVFALLVLAIAAFLITAAMRPAQFCVSRSPTIPATSPTVLAQDKEPGRWKAWSPWQKMDPALHLVVNMDRMVGGEFEKGPAEIKTVAETAPGSR